MIKMEHVVLASPEQMEFIIEGMRNPLNSWNKSDSGIMGDPFGEGRCEDFSLGCNDHSLMQRLSNAGTDHRNENDACICKDYSTFILVERIRHL